MHFSLVKSWLLNPFLSKRLPFIAFQHLAAGSQHIPVRVSAKAGQLSYNWLSLALLLAAKFFTWQPSRALSC